VPVHHLDLDEPLEQPPPLGRGGSRIGCRCRSHRRGSEDRRQQGDQDAPHWAIKIEGAAGQMQKVGIDNIDTGDAGWPWPRQCSRSVRSKWKGGKIKLEQK
jgi:hypothetical protein